MTDNSLNLLLEYSSSSDSEHDCDFFTTSIGDQKETSKPKLPLPNDLLNQFQAQAPVIDDPSQHGGRIRSFPHERNNWATLVYIPLRRDLSQLHTMLKNDLLSHGIQAEIIPEPHMSLSKTLVIPHHWIEPLVDSLGKNMQHIRR